MHAILMAGGKGSRLSLNVEKPLIEVRGRKLIDYVIKALYNPSIDEILAVVSPSTLKTREYLREKYPDIKVIVAPGKGYIADYIYAVEKTGLREPFLLLAGDLPLITSAIIEEIIGAYFKVNKPALAVYVPLSLFEELGLKPTIVLEKFKIKLVPSGINILHGAWIREEQEEYVYISNKVELAVNLNTLDDLKFAEEFLCNQRDYAEG
ncbi:MAG: NTP transferase domain-containing protein [Methanocellales archaeon]